MSSEWQFLITLNEHLRPLRDPVEIQEAAVRLIGEYLHASLVHYAYIDGDEFVISCSYAEGVRPFTGRGALAQFGEPIVSASRRGETVIVNDVSTDRRFDDVQRQQFLARETAAFVGVPLIKDGRWQASFGVRSATPRNWTRDQIAIIEVTADRTWSAGERARAEEALGRSESRQAFLRHLNDTIRPLGDPARIWQETCRLLGQHLHANRVTYGEVDGDTCVIIDDYVDGLPSMAGSIQWRNLGGIRTADILAGGTLTADDTSTAPHTVEELEALQAAGIGAYICPLLIKDGRFVGAFGIHSRSPRRWTQDEITLAQDVADRVWATLEHRKAEAELRANEERLAFLLRLNDTLRSLTDPSAVQAAAARLLGEQLRASRAGYAELDGRDFHIRGEYTHGVVPLAELDTFQAFAEALRHVIQLGETVVVNDINSDPRLGESERLGLNAVQIAAFIGVMLIKGGRVVAAFGATSATTRIWTPIEIALVRDVGERTWEAAERARAEAALREREHRFRLALDACGGASWTWDPRANHGHWDERFRAQFGFGADEPPTFETWLSRVHLDDQPRMWGALNKILGGNEGWDDTYRVVRPDGTVSWIHSLGRAERDGTGQVIRLTGLELDITDRRRMQEALKALRDEQHDRELRLLLETAAQGIVSVDAQGVIVSANRAFEVMFGWAAGELIGQPVEGLMPSVFRDDRESGVAGCIGVRRDGPRFPIEISLTHVPSPTGRTFAFVTDITERQRAASALHERTAELEYRTTQLSRMAWDLTLAEHHAREQIARTLHDGLQQLLVIVALNLDEHLKTERELGVQSSDLISEAKDHIDKAMAVARSVNVELFPPVLQQSGLPDALRWLAKWARGTYKLDVEVIVDDRADCAQKNVRTLVFEAVRELLFNAVKHAQAERVTLELGLDADDQLCITVTDQGVGFEPAELNDRSKAGQVGWGLFSIRERLTLLGGHLEIESAPGRGTRIRVVAPRGAATAGVARIDEPDRDSPAVGLAGDSERTPAVDALRILIVDDHGGVRSTLRGVLHQHPQLSVVGEASDGFEAIAHACSMLPDVVLMDVSMPHMDGIEATSRIRAELPDVCILGLSMQARGESVHAIEDAGAEAYFVKGVGTQQLIDYLLAFHATRRTRARAVS